MRSCLDYMVNRSKHGEGPAPLSPGRDLVAVVAPAGPYPPLELASGLQLLQERGYRTRSPAPTRTTRLAYLAGSDAERQEELVRALLDPAVAAVWAARGGYGLMRLLPGLPWAELAGLPPRWLIGFSDVTALLLPLTERLPAWGAVHGPNLCGLSRLLPPDREALWRLLEQGETSGFAGLKTLHPGRAQGTLIGGNLCLIAHLCGTPFLPRPHAGRLLLLEEVGERPYRLDRMLGQLALSGWLEGVVGVLVGELHGCDDAQHRAEEVLPLLLERWLPGVPAVGGLPLGHGAHNRALRLGTVWQLDATAGTLEPEGHESF